MSGRRGDCDCATESAKQIRILESPRCVSQSISAHLALTRSCRLVRSSTSLSYPASFPLTFTLGLHDTRSQGGSPRSTHPEPTSVRARHSTHFPSHCPNHMSEYSFSYDGYRKFVANQARIARWAEETARAVGGPHNTDPAPRDDGSSTADDSSLADTASSTTLDDTRGPEDIRTRRHTHARIRGVIASSGLARSRSTAAATRLPRPTAASRRSSSMMPATAAVPEYAAPYACLRTHGQSALSLAAWVFVA